MQEDIFNNIKDSLTSNFHEQVAENLLKLSEHPIQTIIIGHGNVGHDLPLHFAMDYGKPEDDRATVVVIDTEAGSHSSISKAMKKRHIAVCFDYGMISRQRMAQMVEAIIVEQTNAQKKVKDEFDWLNLCEPAVSDLVYPYYYSEPRYNFPEAFMKSHKNPKHHNYKNTKKYEQSKGKHRRRQQRRNWKR
jgi:hypothetical protein